MIRIVIFEIFFKIDLKCLFENLFMSVSLVRDAFKNWLDHHQSLSPLTQKTYLTALSFFVQFLQNHQAQELSLDHFLSVSLADVRAFLAYRWSKGIKTESQAVMLSAIKSFYRFLLAQGHEPTLALHFLRRPKLARRLARPIPHEKIEKLLSLKPSQENWVQWRNFSLLIVLYATGMRISEALALNQQHKKEVLYIKCKGGKERVVPLLAVATNAIERYLILCPYAMKNSQDPLFFGEKGKRLQASIFQKYMRHYRKIFSLSPQTTPHSLRHSFASHLLEKGAPIRDVQELLGHACLKSTQHYIETTRTHMQATYNDLHPRANQKDS